MSEAAPTLNVVHDDELPEDGPGDHWASYLPGPDLVPAYLVVKYAAQYRAVVDVLLEAQDTSLTGLSHDDVRARVAAYLTRRVPADAVENLVAEDRFNLEARLDQLVRWGVLTRWQEPARTGEDFLRKRDRYQLTPKAARLHTFWTEELYAEEASAADLTLAPRAISDRLAVFADSVKGRRYRDAATEYQVVITLHHGMATAARTWQRSLAHALSGGPDPDKQEVLWRTLRSYIGMWGEQVDVHSPRIATLMTEFDPMLTESVWRACCRAALEDADDDQVAIQAERWRGTWSALRAWFEGSEGQARRLRRQLRDLVTPWARNMHIMMDTGGTVTRRAELLRLARAIERAPDDGSAYRLWDTATGLFAARHLLLPSEAADDHTCSWADAPPAPVTARFREHGVRAAVGRRAQLPDFSTGRAAARRARAAALAARAEAEAALRRRSGTQFAAWEPLSKAELDLLLEFLGVARADDGAVRTGVTGDGRWRVTLTAPTIGPTTVSLPSPDGLLAAVNWRFELEPQR
jgi:uncharacterized protein (TIGR02677 family)